jgi:hypothetical protein
MWRIEKTATYFVVKYYVEGRNTIDPNIGIFDIANDGSTIFGLRATVRIDRKKHPKDYGDAVAFRDRLAESVKNRMPNGARTVDWNDIPKKRRDRFARNKEQNFKNKYSWYSLTDPKFQENLEKALQEAQP